MRFEAFLPWPPTLNGIWRRAGPRIHRSPKYVAWSQAAAVALCEASPPKTIEGSVSVELRLYAPSRRSYDIDNRAKAVLDLLEAQAVIADDSQVDRLVLRRGPIMRPEGLVHLILERMDSGVLGLPDAAAERSAKHP